MKRAPTPTELAVLVAIVVFVAAPLSTELVALVLKSVQQSVLETVWSLCSLAMSAVWNMLLAALLLWTPLVFCLTLLVVCS